MTLVPPTAKALARRPVLWGFYRNGRFLAQCVDVTSTGVPTLENCLNLTQFTVPQSTFMSNWTRVYPAADE